MPRILWNTLQSPQAGIQHVDKAYALFSAAWRNGCHTSGPHNWQLKLHLSWRDLPIRLSPQVYFSVPDAFVPLPQQKRHPCPGGGYVSWNIISYNAGLKCSTVIQFRHG